MDAPPCRLFVIMARQAPVAAILRRGPSRWYQLVAWDTRRDVFADGAWFRGRIYEEKCDLSPDGTLFLYACHQGSKLLTGYTDSWTAVSRLPWLHALALWPFGTTYGGGGRFITDRKLILRTGLAPVTHPDHPARGLEVVIGSPDLQRSSGEVEGADWCGRDQAGRLVSARDGRLFRHDREEGVEIADLNGRSPEPVAPPSWAADPLE